MSDYAPQEEFLSLLDELREDFAAIRRQCAPIRIRLVHEGENARFQGVERFPFKDGLQAAFHGGAGTRESRQQFDANGHPMFTDTPVLDAAGVPITNSAGEAFAFTPAAHRFLELFGDPDAVARLRASAMRGGQLVAGFRFPICKPLNGWGFSRDDDSRWWALLFEVAWSGRHRLLRAARQLWRSTPKATVSFPYDREQLRQLHDFPGGEEMGIPSAWLDELPDAYKSEIDNAAAACADLARILVAELHRVQPITEPDKGDSPTQPPSSRGPGSEKTGPPDNERSLVVEDVHIEVEAQILTRDGKTMRWTGHETWRPLLELVKNRPNPIDLARWGVSKDVARRVKEMLRRIELTDWADRIRNQHNVGYYFADRG